MSLRHIAAATAASMMVVIALPATAQNQPASAQTGQWKAPRTPWGDPDLRGAWPIDYLNGTPRTRPPQFGARAEYSDEEYAQIVASAEDQLKRYDQEIEVGKMSMGHWTERGIPLRQTSLLVLPENGQMPAPTEEGRRRAALEKTSWNHNEFNVLEDFGVFDRCISRGLPGSMLPGAYNMGIAVWQAPGIVGIQLEMIHETRIVHLDGRAPPADVRNWLGYSVGHWEGDTLVITTTNFEPGSSLGGVPNSTEMTMVERLTPVGPNEIRYQAMVTDPVVLTAPFAYDFPWRRNDDYVQYEYACHEGNVQIRGYIEGTGTAPSVVAKREAAVRAREAVVAGN
jgi:hypothetical protein